MEYHKKLAIVPTEDNKTVNVTVTELQGSGLAYVQNGPNSWHILSLSGEKQSIASIKGDEQAAQFFLEELATLTDWNQAWETIRVDLFQKFAYQSGGIDARIDKARQNALASIVHA